MPISWEMGSETRLIHAPAAVEVHTLTFVTPIPGLSQVFGYPRTFLHHCGVTSCKRAAGHGGRSGAPSQAVCGAQQVATGGAKTSERFADGPGLLRALDGLFANRSQTHARFGNSSYQGGSALPVSCQQAKRTPSGAGDDSDASQSSGETDDEQPRLRELLFGQQLARGRARKLSQELQAAIDVTERLL